MFKINNHKNNKGFTEWETPSSGEHCMIKKKKNLQPI